MPHDGQIDRQLAGLRLLVRARWIVTTIVAIVGMAAIEVSGGNLTPLAGLLIVLLSVSVCNLLFHLSLPRLQSARGLAIHGWAQLLFDLGITTFLVLVHSRYMGGPLFLLYFFHLVSAGLVLPPGGSYKVASLSSLMYGVVILNEYAGWIAHPFEAYLTRTAILADQPAVWVSYFLSVAGLLHLEAFLIEYLAGRIRAGERQARQQLAEMTTLFNASAALASSLELNDVLHSIAEQLARALDATSCYVSDWNMAEGTWTKLAGYVSSQAAPQERVSDLGARYRVEDYPLVTAGLRALQPVLIRVKDPTCDAAYRAHLAGYGGKTALLVPLVTRGEIFGYVEARDSRREREFTPDEIRLAQALAVQAAVAIENAWLYERVKQRTAEAERTARNLELVRQVSDLVISTLDLEQVLTTTAEQMVRLFGVDHSGILIFDEAHTCGEVAAEYPVIGARPTRLPVTGYRAAERIIADPRPLVIEDAQHDPLLDAVHQTMLRLGIRSILIVPLVIRGQTIGSIGLDAIAAPRRFTPGEVALAQTIANQVSVAIENARLYRAECEQRELAETLREVGAALAATLDVDAVLDRLLVQVSRVVPNDATNVMLIERGGYARIVRWRGYERFGAQDFVRTVCFSIADIDSLRYMVETDGPVIISDTHVEPRWTRIPEMEWLRSYAAVPIRARGEVMGFLNVDSATPGFFGPVHAERLRAFADQAAIALENARLYAQVRAEQEQLRAVLESTGDAIIVADAQGAILLFNPAAERTFGVSASQVTGRPLLEAVPALAEPARRAIWPAGAQALHCEIPFSDGRTLFCDTEPVRQTDGTLRGWVSVLYDVTHFKELDRIKSELVTTVSHDLRSPLHLIHGYFDTLIEALGELSADKQALADAVRQALRRMDTLATDLLDLEKIEAGIGLSREQCDLGRVVAEAISDMKLAAINKGVTLNAEAWPALLLVLGDAGWLAQVFRNLLDNAIKYTRPGDCITLRAHVEDGTVIVSMADSGPGIPPDDLPHVFERFYRARHQATAQTRGSGLGLAIVKSIVEQHKGRVWVESTLGQGSTFYVALPVAPAAGAVG